MEINQSSQKRSKNIESREERKKIVAVKLKSMSIKEEELL